MIRSICLRLLQLRLTLFHVRWLYSRTFAYNLRMRKSFYHRAISPFKRNALYVIRADKQRKPLKNKPTNNSCYTVPQCQQLEIYYRRVAFRGKSNDTTLCNSRSRTGQTLNATKNVTFLRKANAKKQSGKLSSISKSLY